MADSLCTGRGQSAAKAATHTGSLMCDWPTLYRCGGGANAHQMELLVLGGTIPATL